MLLVGSTAVAIALGASHNDPSVRASAPSPVKARFAPATITTHASPTSAPFETAAMTPSRYSRAISRICERATLFTGDHQIGTRAGAIAVSRDIRSTGLRRLRRIQGVPKPPRIARTAGRWIAVERTLDGIYAATYLRVWIEIERAYDNGRRAELPVILQRLVHRPDRLKLLAGRLELALHVPDCTGGG
jgi:hypothetical protein